MACLSSLAHCSACHSVMLQKTNTHRFAETFVQLFVEQKKLFYNDFFLFIFVYEKAIVFVSGAGQVHCNVGGLTTCKQCS